MKLNPKFIFLLLSLFFIYSCKDDNGTLEGEPQDIVDENHQLLDDRYGITAVFPKGEWSNSYIDCLPQDINYKEYQYSAIVAGLYADSLMVDGIPNYPTTIYFMRFHNELDPAQYENFVLDYKDNFYDAFVGRFFYEISQVTDTTLADYPAKRFIADRGIDKGDGYEEVFLMYHNKTTYGVTIVTSDKNHEESYPKCADIVSTVKLK